MTQQYLVDGNKISHR